MITGIIISAVWALLQMFDNIDEKYKKWVSKNERNSPVYAKPTSEIEKINVQVKQKTPKRNFFDFF